MGSSSSSRRAMPWSPGTAPPPPHALEFAERATRALERHGEGSELELAMSLHVAAAIHCTWAAMLTRFGHLEGGAAVRPKLDGLIRDLGHLPCRSLMRSRSPAPTPAGDRRRDGRPLPFLRRDLGRERAHGLLRRRGLPVRGRELRQHLLGRRRRRQRGGVQMDEAVQEQVDRGRWSRDCIPAEPVDLGPPPPRCAPRLPSPRPRVPWLAALVPRRRTRTSQPREPGHPRRRSLTANLAPPPLRWPWQPPNPVPPPLDSASPAPDLGPGGKRRLPWQSPALGPPPPDLASPATDLGLAGAGGGGCCRRRGSPNRR